MLDDTFGSGFIRMAIDLANQAAGSQRLYCFTDAERLYTLAIKDCEVGIQEIKALENAAEFTPTIEMAEGYIAEWKAKITHWMLRFTNGDARECWLVNNVYIHVSHSSMHYSRNDSRIVSITQIPETPA